MPGIQSSETGIVCRACGRSNLLEAHFCIQCGSRLRAGEIHAPEASDRANRAADRSTALLEDIRRAFAHVYSVKNVIGEGGASVVYLARDLRRNCDVALKVLRPELGASLSAQRFEREVDISRSLRHPRILPVFDTGEMRSDAALGGSHLFYTTPFVFGESLAARLDRESKLPIPDAIQIVVGVADALQYAHELGVVHRDVKTANIFLAADGRVLLTDFGTARAMEVEPDRLTHTGVTVGTPEYMSPEQLAGEEIDSRSDQFSLACVLYELLTGALPFAGRTAQERMVARFTSRAAAVRAARPTVPDHVDAALQRALEREAADRFQTMAAFADALQYARPGTGTPLWGPLPERVDDKAVFMIMPFADIAGVQEIYRDHVVPVVRKCGFEIQRADDIFGHREIIRDIWTSIGRARFVIADVTGRNANVFYELGMAHAIGKDVIIMTQHSEDVPFDVTHIRHIRYEYTPRGVKKFGDTLRSTIQAMVHPTLIQRMFRPR